MKVVLVALAVLLLFGCSRTKEEILEKARGVETRPQLEKALGRADDINKFGPMEVWTYRGSNGEVQFVIVADRVTLQAAGEGHERKQR